MEVTVKARVGILVIVEVKVCEGVAVGVRVVVGIEAIIAEPIALTEEMICVMIKTKAIRAATIPWDVIEWLR